MPNYDSAGRIPFYLKDGVVKFCLVAENNRIVDKKYITEQCGPAAAHILKKDTILLGLPRGTIKKDEEVEHAGMRESGEEVGYHPIIENMQHKTKAITTAGHRVKAIHYFVEHVVVRGKRGKYLLTLYVDKVKPEAFTPKRMETIVEDKIEQRIGHEYQEGGKWATVAEMEASLEPLHQLSKHRDVMANKEIRGLINSHLTSMKDQIDVMRDIEAHVIEALRIEGETVKDPSTSLRAR